MRILLVGNYAPDKQESMARFAAVLERGLNSRGHFVRLVKPSARFNRRGAGPVGIAKWLGYADKFLLFPLRLRQIARNFDIVHICDHSNSPYLRFLGAKPHLITCHDLLAIRAARGEVSDVKIGKSGQLLQSAIGDGLNRAQNVACVSTQTRDELLAISTLKTSQTRVIFNGLNHDYAPMDAETARETLKTLWENAKTIAGTPIDENARENFVFHVGGNQWYKNRSGVLRIYAQLRQLKKDAPILVMAGKSWTPEMQKTAREMSLEAHVVALEGVSNRELNALYASARALVFPSLAEGFGWPIIEAQACGTPVLASDRAPLTEIGGAAALFENPDDQRAMACALNLLLDENTAQREARREKGIENARRFSTDAMIDDYLDFYNQILKPRVAF